jgi:hypothetical protein
MLVEADVIDWDGEERTGAKERRRGDRPESRGTGAEGAVPHPRDEEEAVEHVERGHVERARDEVVHALGVA